MKFLNGWIDIPDDYIDKFMNDDSCICEYCSAHPDECGEWIECCYNGLVKELLDYAKPKRHVLIDETTSEYCLCEIKVLDFRTGELINLEDLE